MPVLGLLLFLFEYRSHCRRFRCELEVERWLKKIIRANLMSSLLLRVSRQGFSLPSNYLSEDTVLQNPELRAKKEGQMCNAEAGQVPRGMREA